MALSRVDILLAYASSFLVLGTAALLQPRDREDLSVTRHFPWLAAFAFTHSAREFAEVGAVARGDALGWAGVALLLVSYVLLREFARRALCDRPARSGWRWVLLVSPWSHVVVLGIVAAVAIRTRDPLATSAAVRLAVGLPAAIMAAIVLSWALAGAATSSVARAVAALLGAALLGYGLLAGLVLDPTRSLSGWILTSDAFHSVTGVHVQAARAACVLVAALSLGWLVRHLAWGALERQRLGAVSLGALTATLESRVQARTIALEQVIDTLSAREETLADIIRGAQDGFWSRDLRTGTGYLSPRFKELLGYPPDEPLAATVRFARATIHPEDYSRAKASLDRHLKDGTPHDVKVRMLTRQGEYRWFRGRAEAVRDPTGTPIRVAGSMVDIHEQVTAEEKLARSEERMALAIEATGASVWEIDFVTGRTFASERLLRLGGYDIEDIDGSRASWADLIHPDDRERTLRAFNEHLERGTPYDVESRLLTRAGDVRWCRSQGKATFDTDGKPVRMAGVLVDITEQRRTAEALKDTERRFGVVLEGVNEGFFALDHELRFTRVNAAAGRIVGRATADLVGRSIPETFPEASGTAFESALARAVATGEPAFVEDYFAPLGLWLWARVYPSVDGVAILLSDVSARKQAEQELARREQRLQQAVRVANVGIYELDCLSGEIFAAPELRRVLGFPEDSPIDAAAFRDRIHPDDRERVVRVIDASGDPAGTGTYDVEHRYLHPDGTVRWFTIRAQTLFEGEGASRHAVRRIGALIDSTSHRALTEALQSGERRLRQAQGIARIGNWDLDLATGHLEWSDEIYRIFEIDRESFGASYDAFLGVIHPDDRERVNTAYADSLVNRTPYEIVHRLLVGDGRVKHVEERCETDFAPDGTALRSRGTVQDVTDRVQAELLLQRSLQEKDTLLRELQQRASALRESEQKYVALVENINDGILRDDIDGRVTYANQRFLQWFGLEGSELGEISLEDYVMPEWRERIRERHRRRVQGERVVDRYEFEGIRPDGSRIWLDVFARPVVEHGRIVGTQSVIREVTEQKQAERALRIISTDLVTLEGERFYSGLVERLADLLECEMTFIAREDATSPTGWRAVASCVDQVVRGAGPFPIGDAARDAIAAGGSVVVGSGLRQRYPTDVDVRERGVESFAITPLLSRKGARIGFLGVMSRRPLAHPERVEAILHLFGVALAAEMERQRNLRLLHDLVEFSPDGIVMSDRNGRIALANRQAEEMFGWTREELLGQRVEMLVPAALREGHAMLRAGFLGSTEARSMGSGRLNLEAQHRDGSSFPVEISLSPLETDDGMLVAATIRNVTERRALEAQANRRQRLDAIGMLAGGIAHDLNNALGPILMAADILRSEYADVPDIVDTVEQSAKRAAGMVRQLLMFAKGGEGERVAVRLRDLIGEMEKIITSTFPRNIQLAVRLGRDVPDVRGDATQLHQVLLNLCVNARDAMPNGGQLVLELRTETVDATAVRRMRDPDTKLGTYVLLRVRDSGSGIPAATLDKVFDPFFTTKGPDKGTGLGLSTVLGIVKGHGGFVRVESERSLGTVFSVYLPADTGDAETPGLPAEREAFAGRGEMVLYVDDEAALRDVATQVLARLNFTPLTAVDGTDGLLQLAQRGSQMRAIITDLRMPHMDGLAFARAARRLLPSVPIIVASGRIDERVERELQDLGVNGLLNKPFTQGELAEALRAALGEGARPG